MDSEEDLARTKGVWQKYNINPFNVSAEVLDTMSRSLRVFAMGNNTIVSGQCSKRFDELRFLQAGKVPNLAIDMLKLKNLRFMENKIWSLPKKLILSGIKGLKELPGSIGKLRSLRELHLRQCNDLIRLQEGFGELNSLTVLEFANSKSLQELPCDFKKLLSLQSLILYACWLKTLSMSGCKSLLRLPEDFGKLSCLQTLRLSECDKMHELGSYFGCLGALKHLYLSKLPDGFGKLGCLERLDLSGCDKIQELCSDFGCLGALKHLYLSKCKSMSKLPDGFGKLGCLKSLDLSV
ncbi:hypothetical protein SUGI_0751840 [Cryptomeria japonica]|nr:hypothetical protein SUGI_0751840 [Cryptomeria japonica]